MRIENDVAPIFAALGGAGDQHAYPAFDSFFGQITPEPRLVPDTAISFDGLGVWGIHSALSMAFDKDLGIGTSNAQGKSPAMQVPPASLYQDLPIRPIVDQTEPDQHDSMGMQNGTVLTSREVGLIPGQLPAQSSPEGESTGQLSDSVAKFGTQVNQGNRLALRVESTQLSNHSDLPAEPFNGNDMEVPTKIVESSTPAINSSWVRRQAPPATGEGMVRVLIAGVLDQLAVSVKIEGLDERDRMPLRDLLGAELQRFGAHAKRVAITSLSRRW